MLTVWFLAQITVLGYPLQLYCLHGGPSEDIRDFELCILELTSAEAAGREYPQ